MKPKQIRLICAVSFLAASCAESPSAPQDAQPMTMSADSAVSPDMGFSSAMDAGMTPDPDSGLAPPDVGVDAGFQDASPILDTGPVGDAGPSPEERCRIQFSRVEEYVNLEAILPPENRWTNSVWMSDDYLKIYISTELPNELYPRVYTSDTFVMTRTSTAESFTQLTRVNLDVDSFFSNTSTERDLEYVPGVDRFWYTEANAGGSPAQVQGTLMSVSLPDPASPELFDDFQVENLNLSEVNVTGDFRMPTLTPDGLLLIAAQKMPGNSRLDLYEFRRNRVEDEFGEAMRLTVSSTITSDYNPWISPDGLQLLFQGSPLGTTNDIVCAWRNSVNEPFQGPIPYGGPNMAVESTHEMSPFLLNGELFFLRVFFTTRTVRMDVGRL